MEAGTSNIFYNSGFVAVGVNNPTWQFVVNNTLEVRRTGTISQLLFTNTANTGDFRIGGDIFWQGGGGQSLQMGSFHATVLIGDRQDAAFPGFISGGTYPNRSVVIRSSRNVSVPLSIQGNPTSQTANLTEWLNSSGTAINVVNSAGNMSLGVTAPTQKLDVLGNIRMSGALMPNNQPGAVGSVLQSNGAELAPTWVDISSASNTFNWTLGGNNLTGSRNLGTTSNFDLPFITIGAEKMRIMAGGNVGIGTSAPSARLDVNGNLQVAILAAGATTDQIVTVGTNGILNRRTASSFAADAGAITTANNGLTKTGNNVQLGGALVQPTSISGITVAFPLNFTSPTIQMRLLPLAPPELRPMKVVEFYSEVLTTGSNGVFRPLELETMWGYLQLIR